MKTQSLPSKINFVCDIKLFMAPFKSMSKVPQQCEIKSFVENYIYIIKNVDLNLANSTVGISNISLP